jgi:hypothetical protein
VSYPINSVAFVRWLPLLSDFPPPHGTCENFTKFSKVICSTYTSLARTCTRIILGPTYRPFDALRLAQGEPQLITNH